MGCAPSQRAVVTMHQATPEMNNNNRMATLDVIKKGDPPVIYGATSLDNIADSNGAIHECNEQTAVYGATDNTPIKTVESSETIAIYGSTLPDRTDEDIPENRAKRDKMYIPQVEKQNEVHVSVVTQISDSRDTKTTGVPGESRSSTVSKPNSANVIPSVFVDDRLTPELLNEFIQLDLEVQAFEEKHTEEKLALHQTEYKNVEMALRRQHIELEELKKNPVKAFEECDDISSYMSTHDVSILNNANIEDPERKEELEFLDTQNRQEVCEKQLASLQRKLNEISEMLQISSLEVNDLTNKRLKLDVLLENVFNGEYGSDLENRLELVAMQLLETKQHITVAHYKWTSSRALLQHAVFQLAMCCGKWGDIFRNPIHQSQAIYQLATEARNKLIEAHQNCVHASESLKLCLPYWTPEDNKNITLSINLIYTDLTTQATFHKAYAWFRYYHQKLGLQLNWMDQVINNKIVTDYKRVSQEFRAMYRKLRLERLICIKDRVKLVLNMDWNIEQYSNMPEETDENDTLPTVGPTIALTDAHSADVSPISLLPDDLEINNNDGVDIPVTANNDGNVGENDGPPPVKLLSLSELAPTPSSDELFGNLEQLEFTHRKQIEDFEKVQEFNKAKQEEGLKEKLRRRQSKKRKKMIQEEQEIALSAKK